MYSVPILLIVFKRLDTTKKVFEKIRSINPKQLFIAADAARSDYPDEKEKCDEVRKWILDAIDWDCEVKTLFRDENLGCGRGVSSAVTWFFDNVEYGIILEDDCVPSLSFFSFVEELLMKYKDDKRIWQICGHNTMGINPQKNNSSYSFSAIEACWGWATWKDRWQNFSYDISKEDKTALRKNPYFSKKYRRDYWFPLFNSMSSEVKDIWDYQWTYRILVNTGFCAIPSSNLIENVGFGADSTHFTIGNNNSFRVQSYEIENILHPKKIEFDWNLIKFTDKKVFGLPKNGQYWLYLKNILKIILRKLHLFDFAKSMKQIFLTEN